MTQFADISLNGVRLQAWADGSLYWPDRQTLIVSDLHLEKGSSYARRGQMLPPYDSRATLERLARALTDRTARRLICLGDSFHDQSAADRLGREERDALIALTGQVETVWIAGNHDPAPPPDFGGTVVEDLVDGGLVFRHEADAQTGWGEISGHFHPKAGLSAKGRRLSGPCFMEDGRRLIMPAFGSYTGGLSVLDPVYRPLFPMGYRAHITSRHGVLSVSEDRLRQASRAEAGASARLLRR